MIKISLFISFFSGSAFVYGANFDSYRPKLERDVLCGSFPSTDIKSHLQNLKDAGVISSKEKISENPAEWQPFKVANDFLAFGLPIKEVLLFPGYRASSPQVELTFLASPVVVADAIKAQYKTKKLKFQVSKDGTFTSINHIKKFELSIRRLGANSTVSCNDL